MTMTEIDLTYGRAIVQNIAELCSSLSYRNAYKEFQSIGEDTNWSFFTYAFWALYEGIFSHAIKVLDRHKDSASFFYIRNRNQEIVDRELDKQELRIEDIDRVATKLKTIRDKTHFHIDKNAVINPPSVWEKADLTGDNLSEVLDKLWVVLNELHMLHFRRPSGYVIYGGEDVKTIIQLARDNGLNI